MYDIFHIITSHKYFIFVLTYTREIYLYLKMTFVYLYTKIILKHHTHSSKNEKRIIKIILKIVYILNMEKLIFINEILNELH